MSVTFEPRIHRYVMGGGIGEVPSVTKTMKMAGLIDTRWYQDWAAERGTRVHQAVQYHLEGDLDEDTIFEGDRPYFDAYLKFRAEVPFELIASEMHVYDIKRQYAGTVDVVAKIKNELAVLDWKTGQPDRAVAVQLTGYAMAYHAMTGETPTFLASVWIKRDGTYQLKRHEFVPKVFLAALEVTQWLSSN